MLTREKMVHILRKWYIFCRNDEERSPTSTIRDFSNGHFSLFVLCCLHMKRLIISLSLKSTYVGYIFGMVSYHATIDDGFRLLYQKPTRNTRQGRFLQHNGLMAKNCHKVWRMTLVSL